MRLPTPADLLRLPTESVRAVETALAVVPQLVRLVAELSALVQEARTVIVAAKGTQHEAKLLVGAVESTRQEAQRLVSAVESTRREVHDVAASAAETARVVAAAADQATTSADRVLELLTRFEPALAKLAPVADTVADNLDAVDAEALVESVKAAPALIEDLTNDVLPVLDSLDTVGPDLRRVLEESHEMNEMLAAVPGLGRVKKRVEAEQRHEDHH